jgi:hypothetical protein
MAERGDEMNFASTFPVLDIMLGTFSCRQASFLTPTELPIVFPPSFGTQMMYPFTQ